VFSDKHLEIHKTMPDKKEVGNLGEDIACKFLAKKKFKILERNHREKSDEIDIIARSFDGVIVFVEVKTITYLIGISGGILPEDHMTQKKFHRIKRGCLMFIAKHSKIVDDKKGWRIDLIAITLREDDDSYRINHYENILLQNVFGAA
jgi:putative endonuclease